MLVTRVGPTGADHVRMTLLLRVNRGPFYRFLQDPPLTGFLLRIQQTALRQQAVRFNLAFCLYFAVFFRNLVTFVVQSFPSGSFHGSV